MQNNDNVPLKSAFFTGRSVEQKNEALREADFHITFLKKKDSSSYPKSLSYPEICIVVNVLENMDIDDLLKKINEELTHANSIIKGNGPSYNVEFNFLRALYQSKVQFPDILHIDKKNICSITWNKNAIIIKVDCFNNPSCNLPKTFYFGKPIETNPEQPGDSSYIPKPF